MSIRVGLENHVEGRSLAWVLGHPGCYRYGGNAAEALASVPDAVATYASWVDGHLGRPGWVPRETGQVVLHGTWDGYRIDESFERVEDGYHINAWFLHDWKPLTERDVDRGLQLLTWSRADLLGVWAALDRAERTRAHPEERWTVEEILGHVGGAEWWYLDRLGLAFPRADLPDDPEARLRRVRAHLTETLQGLVGSRQVVGTDGEIWSPRKLLRRAVWHERDHTEHVRRLVAER